MNIPMPMDIPQPKPMIYPVGCIVKSCIPVVQDSSEVPPSPTSLSLPDEDTLQHLIELAMIL